MKRFGSVCMLKPERAEEYLRLHAAVWPDVLARITACGIRNYSIFHRGLPDGAHLLFSYFEYAGADFDADMAAMAADPRTQAWWAVCKPCMIPLPDRAPGEWWAGLREVFHHD